MPYQHTAVYLIVHLRPSPVVSVPRVVTDGGFSEARAVNDRVKTIRTAHHTVNHHRNEPASRSRGNDHPCTAVRTNHSILAEQSCRILRTYLGVVRRDLKDSLMSKRRLVRSFTPDQRVLVLWEDNFPSYPHMKSYVDTLVLMQVRK